MKYDNNEIILLHANRLTDRQIAEKLNASPNNIAKKRFRLGLSPNNPRTDYQLSRRDLAIIIGTVLGDSCIRYVHSKCVYPSLTFGHCLDQEEYFLYKTKQLKNICSSYKRYFYKTKNLEAWSFIGKNLKCLVPIRNAFYKDNVKIIPIKLIEEYFTEESIYYWFMDDGSYDKNTNSFLISTDCFSINDLNWFINFLKDKFNLEFSIKKDHSLYLKHKSNSIFVNIIEKYNKCKTMEYKYILCSSRKTPLNSENLK